MPLKGLYSACQRKKTQSHFHLIYTAETLLRYEPVLEMEKQLLLLIRHKYHTETIAFFFLCKQCAHPLNSGALLTQSDKKLFLAADASEMLTRVSKVHSSYLLLSEAKRKSSYFLQSTQ